MNSILSMVEANALVYVAGVITPYVISRFGGVIWTDLQALCAKVLPAKTPSATTAV